MLSSLRSRLLIWYTVILGLVIVTFVGSSCYLFWRTLIVGVDRDLQSSGAELVAALRSTASGDFDLDLPAEYRTGDAPAASSQGYYAVWNRRGELIDQS